MQDEVHTMNSDFLHVVNVWLHARIHTRVKFKLSCTVLFQVIMYIVINKLFKPGVPWPERLVLEIAFVQ